MNVLLTAFLMSFFSVLCLIRLHRRYGCFATDEWGGVQKFHRYRVTRIGGTGVVLGLVAAVVLLWLENRGIAREFALLLVAGIPAFAGGLAEDVTKRVGVGARLLLTMGAAALGFWLLGAVLTRVDVPLVDDLFRYGPVALAVTVVAVGGVANAINIIDGFNGLAGMVGVMILSALGYVAYVLGDHLLWNVCIASVGALLGFFVWNYPRGLIFLGDGGAYLVGFLIGEVSVLLVGRHAEVSAWFPMLLVVYPVFETVFSIYRKKFVRGISPGVPDGLHLHMLVFRRIVRWAGGREAEVLVRRNSATSPYLWLLCSASVIPAVLFWRHTYVLMGFTLGFAVLYVWLYRRIVRFRTPGVLRRG
ncbi:MraY family glycosyltransferase [Tepidiphilus olei]|uniref:MraY family glycosyltransferase n=1 Tax=Tepidiphilus olei TaxID=2502184 RepID=UPI00115EAE6B